MDSDKPLSSALKERLDNLEFNARQRSIEKAELTKPHHTIVGPDYYKKTVNVPQEPVLIATTEDIGTVRARANHIDAVIHFTQEQAKLKKENAPL